jgi:predicted Fe-S protein YdhL (DUF1289 family)
MRNVLLIAGLMALLPGVNVLAQRSPDARLARRVAQEKRRAEKAKVKEAPTPLERWNRMTPEQRQRVLAQMPPERRREFQQKLQQYRSLPPGERQQLRERYQAFSQLPPEQQNHARELFRQFNSLPEDRRPIVRREYEQMRSMSESERSARIASEAFRGRFTPSEQQMLQDLAHTFGTSR